MTGDLLSLALLAGTANYALRVVPARMQSGKQSPGQVSAPPDTGLRARFLAATGPAAIATLFVASALPMLTALPPDLIALAAGTGAVLAVFAARRSVVAATLAGSVIHGLAVLVLG